MQVSKIKSERQFHSSRWTQYGITSYGETNDFPQIIDEIITASKTGNACLDIYEDFVYGMGFVEPNVGAMVVNKSGQTLSKLLQLIVGDHTKFYGFAIHVNYNMNYRVRSMAHIPFETARLCLPDDDGVIRQIATHHDWGHRDRTRKRWSATDIEKFDVFNPDPSVIEAQVQAAGSWEEYKGQILYVSGIAKGELAYTIPKYIAEMTDMRTEQGLANVTGRNVCSNFMLAGILVDILAEDQSQDQIDQKQAELEQFQGDENSSQLWYMTAKNKDEVPVFVSFSGENYDKAFSQTQTIVPDNIGQAFKQPPVLRAKDVNLGLGADVMSNAYKFYNSVTVRERTLITETFERLFSYWWVALENANFAIQPLTYNAGASLYERIGKEAFSLAMEIVKDPALTPVQKRNSLKYGLGFTEDEILKFLPNDTETGGHTEGAPGSGESE